MRIALWLITATLGLSLSTTSCKTVEPYLQTAVDVAQQYSAPSYQETAIAIKQALNNGVSSAVNNLGRNGGFSQSAYKLLLPSELNDAAKAARKLGFWQQVDNFELSMNRAAEQAVPIALDEFKQVIQQMTINDAISIMRGGDTAATDYFKRSSHANILQQFLPIVQRVTNQTGVTQQYKILAPKLNTASQLLGKGEIALDIDQYITDQATQALFKEIAQQEKLIRENPKQRTTELLQKVFGYYSN